MSGLQLRGCSATTEGGALAVIGGVVVITGSSLGDSFAPTGALVSVQGDPLPCLLHQILEHAFSDLSGHLPFTSRICSIAPILA